MEIEKARKIIENTYLPAFEEEDQHPAFHTAYKCLVLCAEMKKDVNMLKELSDPIAHKIAAIFESKLETIEEEDF